jgi:hypothetical protein
MSLDLTRESFRVSIECAHGHVALELFQPIGGFTDDERGLSLTSFASGLRGSSQVEWVISDEPNGHKWSFGRGGFYLARESVSLDVQRWLVLPAWFVALLLGLLSIRLRSAPRPKKNHCHACSYNRMGNTSGVCPECGTEIDLNSKRRRYLK